MLGLVDSLIEVLYELPSPDEGLVFRSAGDMEFPYYQVFSKGMNSCLRIPTNLKGPLKV